MSNSNDGDKTSIEKQAVDAPVQCPANTSDAGKADACKGCPGQELCKAGAGNGRAPDQDELDTRMKAIAHKIFVLAGKGGVGKSSIACNLAIALTKLGKKVGILDVDVCGPSVPRIMRVSDEKITNAGYGWIPAKDPEHGISIMSVQFMLPSKDNAVIWRGPRKTSMIRRLLKDTFWGRLDFLIIDTPPGTSDEHLASVSAATPIEGRDGCLLVTTPHELSITQTYRQANFCDKMNAPLLGIVENMKGYVCTCCEKVSNVFGDENDNELIAKNLNCNIIATIPLDQRMCLCGDAGQCLLCLHPLSPASIAIQSLANKLMSSLNAVDEQWC